MLKTRIEYDGQRYVDEPVYVEVSKALPISLEVNAALASLRPDRSDAPKGPRIQAVIRSVSHFNRVRLRWMAPDGNGGLKPKYER